MDNQNVDRDYDSNQSSQKLQNEFWEISSNEPNCEFRWCTCSRSGKLNCACVRRDTFWRINREQLQRLLLRQSHLLDKLTLDDGLGDQRLKSLPARLQALNDRQLNRKSPKMVFPSPEDQNIMNGLDAYTPNAADDFVHVSFQFERQLNGSQTQSICSALSAIYSLLLEQPALDQLNAACSNPTDRQLVFYSLDNDERVLLIGEIFKNAYDGHNRIVYVRGYRVNGNIRSILSLHSFLCILVLVVIVFSFLAMICAILLCRQHFIDYFLEKAPTLPAPQPQHKFVHNQLKPTLNNAALNATDFRLSGILTTTKCKSIDSTQNSATCTKTPTKQVNKSKCVDKAKDGFVDNFKNQKIEQMYLLNHVQSKLNNA